ncbi:MAG: T9SS type A sorting domain-containing protein, partial [Ignavibacteria bacterium]|nr:T9SS type A sorting domain-containing protein [Ignavibacteria bacterium]
TPSASSASGDIKGLIELAVSEANDSYVNSGIDIHLNLVCTLAVNYSESGNYDTDLNRFKTEGDNFMDEVHMNRQAYGADICVLILNNDAYCGLAAVISANASSAFCAVHYDCATGYYSFAHEIGHLQGARHNLDIDPTLGYNHGYIDLAHNWRTIMAYPAGSTVRIKYWSNPDKYYNGYVMGTTTYENNARTLNESANIISTFFYRPTSAGTLVRNETWFLAHDLTGNVYVPSGISLTLKPTAIINLNGYSIISTGGTIVNEGASITGVAAYIKTNSNVIVGYCGSIQSACNAVASGQKVEIKPGSYNGGFSLNSKSDVTISGYGTTINGTINLNNNSYCNLYGVYMPAGQVYISGGIGIIVMDVRSDLGNHSMNIQNTTNNAVYGLTATNGDMNDFGVNIYNSNGDICRSSRIENQMVGIYLYGTSSYNVNEDYFCNNGYDVDAEGGAYAYLLHNTHSSISPLSAYGNYFLADPNSVVECSSPSSLAKSNTASLSMNNQSEVKGTPAGDLDRMYLDLIHRTSQDTALDHKGRIEKYKTEYLGIAEKSKDELKKSFNDFSKLKSSLSLTVNCLRYLGEEGSLTSYLNELLGMSDLQAYSPYIKKYLIPGLISRNDFTGAIALCNEIQNSKDIDKDLTCEMLYEKGLIHRFYLNNNTEAYRAFSSITAKYPDHPLGKMAIGQISDMPGIEVEKPGLKSLGNTSEGFTCSNYPNPFNPSTRFNFSIPSDGFTELKIYNSLGQEVKTLVSDYLAKGKYTFEWNATSYSSGIYYYFLKSGNNVTTSKIILLK